jgi:hypothetical protein
MKTYNSIVHHGGGIHGKYTSHKRSHMDNKIDDGFRENMFGLETS